MSKPMNYDEFNTLINHIATEHSPAQMNKFGRCVKYVDPHIDMRDGAIFSIEFRGFGWDKAFHTQNECRNLSESLFNRCMAFLDEKKV